MLCFVARMAFCVWFIVMPLDIYRAVLYCSELFVIERIL